MADKLHSRESSFRENLIEHLFIAELLKHSWNMARDKGLALIEISRAEVDRGGYDLIAEHKSVLRHIQLKSSVNGSKVARQKVHVALGDKPSGCVVWVCFDDVRWELGPFLFLGGDPQKKIPALGDNVAKHTKGDASGEKKQRPKIRTVNKGQFERLEGVDQLWEKLFG